MKYVNKNRKSLKHWYKIDVSPSLHGIKHWCQNHGDRGRFYIETHWDEDTFDFTTKAAKVVGYSIYFEHAPDATLFALAFT